MDIFFYNTLPRKKELFKPIDEKKLEYIHADQLYIKMQQ